MPRLFGQMLPDLSHGNCMYLCSLLGSAPQTLEIVAGLQILAIHSTTSRSDCDLEFHVLVLRSWGFSCEAAHTSPLPAMGIWPLAAGFYHWREKIHGFVWCVTVKSWVGFVEV